MRSRLASIASRIALVVAALSLVACDPAGPGVAGTISLGPDVDPTAWKTLEMRAAPDFGTPFDPAHPNFVPDTDWVGAGGELSSLSFPLDYTMGKVLGSTPQKHWRVLGWLSAAAPGTAGDFPASGEPFGTQAFDLMKCGPAGGHCATTSGIDFTIEHVAP